MGVEPLSLVEKIRSQAQQQGFQKIGFASLASPPDLTGLQQWLAKGYQADMSWMNNAKRWDPTLILPGAKTIICVGMNYYTPFEHDPQAAKISRYAWGRDYHRVLGKGLKALTQWMDTEIPDCQTKWYVDTGPITEKPWAMQAGLGWIGKNSLLLTREYGSWIFLGVVITTLDLPADPPHTPHCGTCTRCLEACPTEAITKPYWVDSNRCIAYHTLENHDANLPDPIAKHLQGWVAGCDICQDVCPWNQRFAQPTPLPDFEPYPGNLNPDPEVLATLSTADFDQQFRSSALRRLKVQRLQRNAQAVLRYRSKSSR